MNAFPAILLSLRLLLRTDTCVLNLAGSLHTRTKTTALSRRPGECATSTI